MPLLISLLACAPDAADERSLLERSARFVLRSDDVHLGQAVFGLGDIDGSGTDELGVAWAPGIDLSVEPRLSVWFGVPTGEFTLDDAELEIVNDSGNGWFVDSGECDDPRVAGKRNVVPLGDIDGDGLGELAIGFGSEMGSGQVSVFSGEQLVGSTSLGTSDARWRLIPQANHFGFGTDLSAGDVDGDGVNDLVIGAPITDAPVRAGEVYVVFGAELAQNTEAMPYARSVGARIGNDVAGEHFGERVLAIGDADGDGRSEIAVLAPGCETIAAGRLVIIDGSEVPGTGDRRTLAEIPELVFRPDAEEELVATPFVVGNLGGTEQVELLVGGLVDPDGEDAIGVFEGETLLRVPYPARYFSTGADSTTDLHAAMTRAGPTVFAHDGGDIIRVSDPYTAEGWRKADSWPAPCVDGETRARYHLLAPLDSDGDGADELAVGEPWLPCGESEDLSGLVLVFDPDEVPTGP